jgi:hypothetical protein
MYSSNGRKNGGANPNAIFTGKVVGWPTESKHMQPPTLEPDYVGYTGPAPYFHTDTSGKFAGGGADMAVWNSSGFVSAGGYMGPSGYCQGQVKVGANLSQNSQAYVEGSRANTGQWSAGMGFGFKF